MAKMCSIDHFHPHIPAKCQLLLTDKNKIYNKKRCDKINLLKKLSLFN